MIDSVYHIDVKTATTLRAPTPPTLGATWTPESNPAVASLLDHLAEELAREYIRLMEAAAMDGCNAKCHRDREEG